MGPTETQSKVIIQIMRSTMDRKYFAESQTIRMHITDRGVVLPQFKHEGLLVEERPVNPSGHGAPPRASRGCVRQLIQHLHRCLLFSHNGAGLSQKRAQMLFASVIKVKSQLSLVLSLPKRVWRLNYKLQFFTGRLAITLRPQVIPHLTWLIYWLRICKRAQGPRSPKCEERPLFLLNAAQRTTAERGLEVAVGQQL